MYTKLLNFAKHKPIEYADSTSKFWDDDHISKYMLEAHLNPKTESASRQHAFIYKSAKWIADLAGNAQMKSLLDLGCGPGLYTEAFHALGFTVTGIDFSKRSITYAMEQAAIKKLPIVYYYQNYLQMDYENKFDIVTLIFCDFGVLKPSDRATILGKIKRALKPGGMLILDVFTNNQYANFAESRTVEYADSGFWSSSPYLCVKNNYCYHNSKTYLEQYIIVTEAECRCFNIWNKAFDQDTLGNELKVAGFTNLQFYDDVGGAHLSNDSTTLCVTAK